jgi:hypothetical protein
MEACGAVMAERIGRGVHVSTLILSRLGRLNAWTHRFVMDTCAGMRVEVRVGCKCGFNTPLDSASTAFTPDSIYVK